MNRIAILRLITGEELLTEVTGMQGDNYLIKNPVQVVVMPNPKEPNAPKVALAPWLQFAAKKEQEIPFHAILLDYEPIDEFKNQYKTIHGGIVVPPQKLILPN